MKRIFLLLTFLGSMVNVAIAQQVDNYKQDTTTLYQRTKGFFSDPIRSKWRQEVKEENGLWVINLYDKKRILQEKISFTDKNLEERKGPYILYQNGNVKEEGHYDKGYKTGEWKSYYPNNQIFEKVNYAWDKFNGASLSYWENGQLKASKNYINGVKSGEWKLYYQDGKLALHELYGPNQKLEMGSYLDEKGNAVDLDYVKKIIAH